jgi:antitoxin HicB
MMDYPAILTRDDNDTILITFPDFEGVISFGEDEADALAHGQDALASLIDAYIKDRRPIPLPSARKTGRSVTLPALLEVKVQLYETMRVGRITKTELGRRLKWHLPQVDRLLAMTHASQLGQVEAAFAALGKRLVVSVDDAAPVRRTTTRRSKRSTPRRVACHTTHKRRVALTR